MPKIPVYQEVRITAIEPRGAIAAAANATKTARPIARMNGSGMKRSNRPMDIVAKLRRRGTAAVNSVLMRRLLPPAAPRYRGSYNLLRREFRRYVRRSPGLASATRLEWPIDAA